MTPTNSSSSAPEDLPAEDRPEKDITTDRATGAGEIRSADDRPAEVRAEDIQAAKARPVRRPLRQLLWRSLRCRCPVCGKGKLFRQWVRMHSHCPHCDEVFAREDGYFLGSIYFNYGLTAIILAISYPILLFQELLPENVLLGISLAFCVVFPVIFFPFARSLWLGFDEFCDPRDRQRDE